MYCTGEVRTDIEVVPQVLVIKINREYTVFNGTSTLAVPVTRKHTHAVSFPDSLVVKDVQLFLTGVIVHIGESVADGHYTAYARPDGCQWMEMNDGNAP